MIAGFLTSSLHFSPKWSNVFWKPEFGMHNQTDLVELWTVYSTFFIWQLRTDPSKLLLWGEISHLAARSFSTAGGFSSCQTSSVSKGVWSKFKNIASGFKCSEGIWTVGPLSYCFRVVSCGLRCAMDTLSASLTKTSSPASSRWWVLTSAFQLSTICLEICLYDYVWNWSIVFRLLHIGIARLLSALQRVILVLVSIGTQWSKRLARITSRARRILTKRWGSNCPSLSAASSTSVPLS